MITETATCFFGFAFSFQRHEYFADLDIASAFKRSCSFIQQLLESN